MKDRNSHNEGLLPGLGGPPAARKVDAGGILNLAQQIEEFLNAKGVRREMMVEACLVCASMTVGSAMGLAGARRKNAMQAWRDLATSSEALVGLSYMQGVRQRAQENAASASGNPT